MAAYIARDGFTGARGILEGAQGMAAGMSSDADPARARPIGLGTRWALAETSFKFHASCRHTHPAADALLQVDARAATRRRRHVEQVTAHVHQGAIDVLGPVIDPQTVHQSKFSMGTVLGADRAAGPRGPGRVRCRTSSDAAVVAFRDRVTMVLDPEVDAAYPARWIGKVTRARRATAARCRRPRRRAEGRSRQHAERAPSSKTRRSPGALSRRGASEPAMRKAIARIWALADAPRGGAAG